MSKDVNDSTVLKDWDLERLDADLADVKQQHTNALRKKGLSSTEKACLRGLLCGDSPDEIATKINREPNGLRVDLSRGLYRYVRILTGKNEDTSISWRDISKWLEEAGYKTSKKLQDTSDSDEEINKELLNDTRELLQNNKEFLNDALELLKDNKEFLNDALELLKKNQNQSQLEQMVLSNLRIADIEETKVPFSQATQPSSSDFPQKPVANPKGDYRHLRELLEAGKWKEADLETMNIILKITNRKKEKWLREKQDIGEITCEDIRIMNNLWEKYSNNQFGFKAQQEIWQKVRRDVSKFDSGYIKFGDPERIRFAARVGWRVNNDWLPSYDDFTFNLNAPKGHLPTLREPNVKIISWKSNFRGFLTHVSNCLNI